MASHLFARLAAASGRRLGLGRTLRPPQGTCRGRVFAAPGQSSGVIDTPDAVYLMLVEDKKPAHAKPLADVRGDIEKTLRLQEQAQLRKAVDCRPEERKPSSATSEILKFKLRMATDRALKPIQSAVRNPQSAISSAFPLATSPALAPKSPSKPSPPKPPPMIASICSSATKKFWRG